jgi:hypothetical protein
LGEWRTLASNNEGGMYSNEAPQIYRTTSIEKSTQVTYVNIFEGYQFSAEPSIPSPIYAGLVVPHTPDMLPIALFIASNQSKPIETGQPRRNNGVYKPNCTSLRATCQSILSPIQHTLTTSQISNGMLVAHMRNTTPSQIYIILYLTQITTSSPQ